MSPLQLLAVDLIISCFALGYLVGHILGQLEARMSGTDVNILARVEAAMRTDTERQDKQSDLIAEEYTAASLATREALDRVFAALCGWSLASILAGEDSNGDECEDDDER